jgi:hypothetical protein
MIRYHCNGCGMRIPKDSVREVLVQVATLEGAGRTPGLDSDPRQRGQLCGLCLAAILAFVSEDTSAKVAKTALAVVKPPGASGTA